MPASRVLPTREAADLLCLVREFADKELAPRATEAEADETFPRELFKKLGGLGVLGLPYPQIYGGSGQPYEVYLQVLEEVASVWASVSVGISVHALSCFGLLLFIWVSFGGPPPSLALTDSVVTANRVSGSAGITVQGGGLFTTFPVTLTRTVIAGNKPDQCFGC